MMKKICILQNGMYFGGTDVFVLNLVRGLIRDGYEVLVILSLDEDKVTPKERELLELGARIVKTSALEEVKSKINHLRKLYRILKEEKPDVFQTNIDLFNGPNLLVSWLAKVPIRECHSHNSQQDRELSQGRTFAIRIYQRIMRWMCWKFSNRRCGCSNDAMNFLFGNKWKNEKHSRIIHNGIVLLKFQPQKNILEKRKELDLKKRYNICTVGRISYQKNPLFIVDVLNELFKIRNDCDFLWIGSGDLESQVHERISKYGISDRIHFLGNRDDVFAILPSMDVFFLPSNFEGLGIVLIEAQAAGLPCVASNVVPKEANCGSIMYISLDEQVAVWAKKLSDVLDKKIELNVNQEKIDKYSIENMVKEMEEVFE